MTREELFAMVKDRAVNLLEVEPDQVTDATSLRHDLDADSLDVAEFTMDIEDRLDIRLPEEEVVDLANFGEFVDLVATKLAEKAPAAG